MMRMKGLECVLTVLTLFSTVLSAIKPDYQSLVVPLPSMSQHASDTSRPRDGSPGRSMTTPTSIISNSSQASNLTNLSVPPLTCFKQNPMTPRIPIVLEDCYRMFVDIFLVPNPLLPKLAVPWKDTYYRQNGNCIFSMKPIPEESLPTHYTEIQLGTTFAKIVNLCVRAETEYFGGFQELIELSGWIVQVTAVPRPR